MLPSLNRLGILIDFKINQDFIATVLCINKEEVVPTCKGNCQLMKQLKKTEEPGKSQAPGRNSEKSELFFFIHDSNASTSKIIVELKSVEQSSFQKHMRHIDVISKVFHPPKYPSVLI
jgi:hypothetical protein